MSRTGWCPECGQEKRLREIDGKLFAHHEPPTTGRHRQHQPRCAGGGQPPVKLADVAQPCPAPGCVKPAIHKSLHRIPAGGPKPC
jgi:hypothetical protein